MLGRTVSVRSTSAQFAADVERLLRSLPAAAVDGASADLTLSAIVAQPSARWAVRPFHFLYRQDWRAGRTTHTWQLFRYLEAHLDLFLAENVTDYLLLHSGAVSRNGAGIILPAASGSGKSSLTLALVQHGYRYHSDELAVVEPATGQLHAFPKPFSIKNTTIFPELGRQTHLWFGPEGPHPEGVWYIHPEDVAPGVPDVIGTPVPIRYIVFPQYDRTAEPALRPLTPGEAMRELISNSVNFDKVGKRGLHLLAGLVEAAQSFSLTINGLEGAVQLLDDLSRGQAGGIA